MRGPLGCRALPVPRWRSHVRHATLHPRTQRETTAASTNGHHGNGHHGNANGKGGPEQDDRRREFDRKRNSGYGSGRGLADPETGGHLWAWLKEHERNGYEGLVQHVLDWAKSERIQGQMRAWSPDVVAEAVRIAEAGSPASDTNPTPTPRPHRWAISFTLHFGG